MHDICGPGRFGRDFDAHGLKKVEGGFEILLHGDVVLVKNAEIRLGIRFKQNETRVFGQGQGACLERVG
ncbi:hypothetical protein GCM10011363_23030 [Marivita lacus]|uniref:Uncharacterized protein n=1 Tax=Marivita lacus TaxID=1323742 RepID=A0ABQ1KSM7_9RHOB|nr:hypothetical protein GCM10011363_23030 [Marivita lacus]